MNKRAVLGKTAHKAYPAEEEEVQADNNAVDVYHADGRMSGAFKLSHQQKCIRLSAPEFLDKAPQDCSEASGYREAPS